MTEGSDQRAVRAGGDILADLLLIASGMPANEAAGLVKSILRRRGVRVTVLVSSDGVMHIAMKLKRKDDAVHGAA